MEKLKTVFEGRTYHFSSADAVKMTSEQNTWRVTRSLSSAKLQLYVYLRVQYTLP